MIFVKKDLGVVFVNRDRLKYNKVMKQRIDVILVCLIENK